MLHSHAFKDDQSGPESQLLNYLEDLASNKKNTVYVVSRRDKETMEKWFGSISKLNLGAENGFFYKTNSEKSVWNPVQTVTDW